MKRRHALQWWSCWEMCLLCARCDDEVDEEEEDADCA